MVARKSATPHARKVVAATVRNCEGVLNPNRKKIVNGTPIPITITPTIKRGPDMARYCMRVYWDAPVTSPCPSARAPRSCWNVRTLWT